MNKPTPTQAVILAIEFQAVRGVLKLLVRSGTANEAGRKALLLAFILDPKLFANQKALAGKLGVSPGRCSQMLNTIRRSSLAKTLAN